MNKLLIGAAAIGLVTPALAQVAPAPSPAPAPATQRAPIAAKVHTRAEVQAHVAQMFARLDTDRDGFVTRAEADSARESMRARFGERMKTHGEEHRGQAFERLDTDKDGAISRSEWDAGRQHREQRIVMRREQRAGGAQRTGGMHRMMMLGGRMFEMADANRDGRVSLAEAQAGALQHFDMMDSNRDGRITPDERMQMRQRMRTERRSG